jgi:hypothetical protein
MRTPAVAWTTARNAETVVGVIRVVTMYNESNGDVIPLNPLLHKEGISLVTKRIEQDFNEFQPAEVSFTLDNDDTLFNSAGTGYFDALQFAAGYRIVIWIGIDGIDFINPATPNCFIFDGHLYEDSVIKHGRETIELTAHGWLKNAEKYNAEEIADQDNPPFKTISGLEFVSATGQRGAKKMVYGIENTVKYLEYDGGERVYLYSAGNPGSPLELWDSVRESSITVNYAYANLPTEGTTDYFTVISVAGVLTACYWYENIKLETIISYIYDYLNITNQDIDVREIETGITDKHFVYLEPFYTNTITNEMKITALKVVNYTPPNITMLVAIEEKKDVASSLWRLIINTSTWEYTSLEIHSGFIGRIVKFVFANNRTWVIYATSQNLDAIQAGLGERWVATGLRELAADWSGFTFIDNFTMNLPVPDPQTDNFWDFPLANTCSAANHTNNIYYVRQEKVGFNTYHLSLEHYDALLNVFAIDEPTLRANGVGGHHNLISEDYGTVAWQDVPNMIYYFASNYYVNLPEMWLSRYNITTATNETGVQPTLNNNIATKVLDARWERVGQIEYAHMKVYAQDALMIWHYQDWWFLRGAVPPWEVLYDDLLNLWKGRYFDTNHPIASQYQTSWFVDNTKGSKWFIKHYDARDPSIYGVETSEALIPEYEGIISAPMIYKSDAGGFHYCGCLIDLDSYSIVPYVYTSGALATVKVADFTGYSCRDALKYLAEAFLDYHDIYEIDSARFYYRGTNLGAGTLDELDCIREKTTIEYWDNWCDGVIVENSKRNLRYRLGNTSYGARVISIDNRFLSEQTCEIVAEWYWEFFNKRRRLVTVEIPMYIEPELMDKITLTLRNSDGTVYETFDTLLYEISFYPSPGSDTSMNTILKLLEIDGVTIHVTRLVQLPSHKILIP